MTDAAALNALLTVPFFWQAALLALAIVGFGLVGLMVRSVRLNRDITLLTMRVTALENRPGTPTSLPQKTALLPQTDFAHNPPQPSAVDTFFPEFSADSMIEKAISMIKAGDTAERIQLKLDIEPELLSILIQQHKHA